MGNKLQKMKEILEGKNIKILIEEFNLIECSQKKKNEPKIKQKVESWPKTKDFEQFKISYNGVYWLHLGIDKKEPIYINYNDLSFLLARECLKDEELDERNWLDGIPFRKSTISVSVRENGSIYLCDFLYDGVIFMSDDLEFISYRIKELWEFPNYVMY